jgi:hypothetical protein
VLSPFERHHLPSKPIQIHSHTTYQTSFQFRPVGVVVWTASQESFISDSPPVVGIVKFVSYLSGIYGLNLRCRRTNKLPRWDIIYNKADYMSKGFLKLSNKDRRIVARRL